MPLKTSQHSVDLSDAGHNVISDSAKKFDVIKEHISRISQMTHSMNETIGNQTSIAHQIEQDANYVNKLSQECSDIANESDNTIDKANATLNNLKDMVERFEREYQKINR